MDTYYIDFEFTNGNYYIGDIFEVACISSDKRQFHRYINIDTTIPKYIRKLCNVDMTLVHQSPSFHTVINELISFIKSESPTLIAHGGYLHDFPLLITNCMKHQYEYSKFKDFKFIDSVDSFTRAGYTQPGLTALSGKDRQIHSSLEDVKLLQDIIYSHPNIKHQLYTYDDIMQYTSSKMPLSINDIYQASQRLNFEQYLQKHSKEKTALNKKQVLNIVNKIYLCNHL